MEVNKTLPLIEVKNVKMYFSVSKGLVDSLLSRKAEFVRAVDGVSFEVEKGEVLGLAGESGSGKTTMGRLCVRLLRPTEGEIIYDGNDIAKMKGKELRVLRRRLQFTFQDPTSSLNPRLKIGDAIADALRLQGIGTSEEIANLVVFLCSEKSRHITGEIIKIDGGQYI